ncbi:SusC/RagA family TonB-linked outer membrane protein [Desertivirga brevis]|uniref:SusC/RagA family TonB-linked outer membrane protein n=1 Tax=Desertivirga brevis TaxID=2810310 RepID=UPI001F6233CC|nr:SusC/RagA family TonB-linked outer membrane protein [Pedobacter sp. SYSU D00873]
MKEALHSQWYVAIDHHLLRKGGARPRPVLAQVLRIMKLTGIFILLACMQLSAAVYSQSVTLDVKNSKLDQVFTEIRRQTGFNFLYNNRLLKKARPVTLKMQRSELKKVLEEVFESQPLSYDIIENTIIVEEKGESFSDIITGLVSETIKKLIADQPVKGVVSDEKGEPLPGVNVQLKIPGATPKVVVTDINGKYQFTQVPENATLVFTMIGFKTQEIKFQGKAVLDVKLQPNMTELKNVVVTGYQEINKESFTGTAVTIKGADLKKINPQNLLQSIQAFDPSFKLMDNNLLGSNPNALPNINVRGSSALPTGNGGVLRRDNFNGNVNLPAFMLDGYEVSLQKVFDLDINRIESITLLKDAAATAIYGSRAANGVLVITTRAPKDGKLQVSYNYELNVNAPDLSDYNVLNAAEKLQYELMAGVYSSAKQNIPQDDLDELYYQKMANVVGGVNTYWMSQPLRTAAGQKHSVYLEGGSPVFRYGVDLRYQNRPGVMKGSARDQYSGGMNFSYNKNNKFQFRNDLAITQVKASESPYGNFSTYVRMNPYYPLADGNGNMIREIDRFTDFNGPGGTRQTENVLNPLYDATLSSFNKANYTEIIDNLSAEAELSKGLRLRAQMSLTSRMSGADRFTSPQANEFFYYEASRLDEKGKYWNRENRETIWDGNMRLTWLKQIVNHSFNFLAGVNVRSELSDLKDFEAIGFANDRFTSIGFAAGYAEDGKPFSSLQKSRLFGSFLSTNYSFKNKYLMDATVRADGSSKFGVDNKLAPFWSLGLGWNVHREGFFKSTMISQLRLRATTGVTGSVSFDPYLSKTTYEYYRTNWYSTGIGATVSNYGNENLGWQKTHSTDFGIDLGLFKDRIFISPRIYRKLTKDILADITLPPSTGFQSYKENLGDMENKGLELTFRWEAIRSKDFSLSLTANMASNRNKIVRISNSLKKYNDRVNDAQGNDDDFKGVPLLRFNEGQSIDAIYAVPSLGIDPENGREVFVKQNGSLTYTWDARDITVVGNATPKAYGFFGGTFSYKRWMLTANFETRFGGELYNQTLVDRVENADPRFNVDSRVFEDKWKQSGDMTFYRNIADLRTTNVSSRFVQADNLINLQSLYLSYDVPKKLASKISMSNLRFSLNANDVARWSSIKQERGIDYPFANSVTFSLQAGF